MLLLKQLTLNNFLSHKNTVIGFKKTHRLLLDGLSGGGKSAIVEALVWSLYGQGRVDNRSLIKRGSTAASVELVLNAGEDKTYTIHRSINNKGKHELKVSWCGFETKKNAPVPVAGLKNLQEYVEKTILKSSYLLFVNSVVYPQDNLDSFVKQTAARRKDIILEIINATGFDQYNDKAKTYLSSHKIYLAEADAELSVINSQIKKLKDATANLPSLEQQESVARREYEYADSKAIEAMKEEADIKRRAEKLDADRAKIDEIQALLHKNDETIRSARERIDGLGPLDEDVINTKLAELAEKSLELKKLEDISRASQAWLEKSAEIYKRMPGGNDDQFQNEIQQINDQLIHLLAEKDKALPDWVCPQCHLITPVETIVPQIAGDKIQRIRELEERLTHKKQAHEDFKVAMEEYAQELRMLGERPQVDSTKLKALSDEVADLRAYEARAAALNANKALVEELQKTINTLTVENDALTLQSNQIRESVEKDQWTVATAMVTLSQKAVAAATEKNRRRVELESLLGRLAEARSAATALQEDTQEALEASRKRDKLLEDINSLELVKDAFGANGVKAIMIDYIIPQLEDKINNILGKISEFRIRLDTQRSGISGETTLEGLFISVFNPEGEELAFDSFSGGERVKIIMAISEALSEVQQTGFRVLDEAFIGLDQESIDGFAEAMTVLQERFEQLICISHLDTIKTMFPERITVLKKQGTSVIV